MNLSDSVIAHIAQLVQLAILTGTDVVDHLRQVEVSYDEETNKLFLSEAYSDISQGNIDKMLEEAVGAQNNEV